MDLSDLENKLNQNTKAVVVVHLGGYPVDLERLKEIQINFEKKCGFKFVIIEGIAHAFGAKTEGQKIGNTGNISTFAFRQLASNFS